MDGLTFDEWWREFLLDGLPRQDPYDARERLTRYIEGLSTSKRDAFVSELTELTCRQGEGWAIAAEAVMTFANAPQRARILAAVESLPHVRPPAPGGDYREKLLRILAKDPDGAFLRPVIAYGYEPIGPGFTAVVWALWPHAAGLFATLYARCLAGKPREWWADTAIVQALIGRPDALLAVREALIREHPRVWPSVREAVLEASSSFVGWYGAEHAALIERICER